jgi:hypothetical protein
LALKTKKRKTRNQDCHFQFQKNKYKKEARHTKKEDAIKFAIFFLKQDKFQA